MKFYIAISKANAHGKVDIGNNIFFHTKKNIIEESKSNNKFEDVNFNSSPYWIISNDTPIPINDRIDYTIFLNRKNK